MTSCNQGLSPYHYGGNEVGQWGWTQNPWLSRIQVFLKDVVRSQLLILCTFQCKKSWNWLDRFLWHNIIVEVILKKPSCSGLQKVIWIKPSCRHNIDTLVLFWSKLKSKLYSSNGPFSIKQNVWFKISFYIAIDSQLTHFFSIPDTPIYFNILVFSIPNLVNAKFKLIN